MVYGVCFGVGFGGYVMIVSDFLNYVLLDVC